VLDKTEKTDRTDKAGDPTRARILDAALDLFGERGLTGVTVRDIAARAKVNVAAISYHFGGKDELYRAVATQAAEGLGGRVFARVAPLMEQPPGDPDAALAALESLVETIVDVIVGPPEMRRVARFILREQMQPTAAFEIIYGTLARLHGTVCRFLGGATGRDPDSPAVRLRVFALVGQVLVFRIVEAAVQRRMDIDTYDEAFLAGIKTMLKENVRAVVTAMREETE